MHLLKLCCIYVLVQIAFFVLLRHTYMINANKITIFYVFDESEDLRNTLQLVN